jgi:glucose-1-phosphate cytidylyltransferase
MKCVILAGGLGTRISEETHLKPKPMVDIGGMPMLWHIMKTYSAYGINDFVICCGYKGYMIKEYFANYFLHTSDITIDMKNNNLEVHQKHAEPWKVTMIDTGINTMTGGRLKKIQKYVDDGTFCFTYGDGLSDININNLLKFHKKNKTFATTTAVQPPGRYGDLEIKNNKVTKFIEKPLGDGSFVNGGYFVLEPQVFDYIKGNSTVWEKKPLETLANENQLSAFMHKGFWHAVDTLRDKNYLEELWNSKNTPWKIWK